MGLAAAVARHTDELLEPELDVGSLHAEAVGVVGGHGGSLARPARLPLPSSGAVGRKEVREIIVDAHRCVAPKTLVKQLDAGSVGPAGVEKRADR